MKSRYFTTLMLAGALALAASIIAAAQNAAPGEAAAPAPAARPGGGLVILDFKPAMDDLMTMLVQPRHIKLYYAGAAEIETGLLIEFTAAGAVKYSTGNRTPVNSSN
jgi:hypothetical protein